MFITESRLKQIILEEMGALEAEKLQNMEPEGSMVRDQLLQMAEYATFLANNMPEDAHLAGWVQSKITLANDYISKVKHYLEEEMWPQMGGGCGEPEEMPVPAVDAVAIQEET